MVLNLLGHHHHHEYIYIYVLVTVYSQQYQIDEVRWGPRKHLLLFKAYNYYHIYICIWKDDRLEFKCYGLPCTNTQIKLLKTFVDRFKYRIKGIEWFVFQKSFQKDINI